MTSDPKYLQIHNNPPAERILWEKARSRFKEEAFKALEGKKRCPDPVTKYLCVACEESGHEAHSSQDCVDVVIQDAIETIKKL